MVLQDVRDGIEQGGHQEGGAGKADVARHVEGREMFGKEACYNDFRDTEQTIDIYIVSVADNPGKEATQRSRLTRQDV